MSQNRTPKSKSKVVSPMLPEMLEPTDLPENVQPVEKSATSDEKSGAIQDAVKVWPVLPLPDVVIFPNSISPLFVVRAQSIAALDAASATDHKILIVTQKNAAESPKASDLYEVGTVSQILQTQRLPDNSLRVFIEGQEIVRVQEYMEAEKILMARGEPLQFTQSAPEKRLLAMRRAVLNQFETYARLSERIPEDLFLNIKSIEDPLALCHMIANYSAFKTTDKQAVLEITEIAQKFLQLSKIFSVENELLGLEGKILNQVRNQIGKNQKEYFLSEQLKVIEKELGINEEDIELEELQKAIDESKMSKEAREKAQRELNRMARMAPMSPESTVSRSYIEWLLDYPWGIRTEDKIDLVRALRILNHDHYGLEKVKERILEYLAVLRLVSGKMRGSILCLVGPPGVGKTSLAKSIARAMGRKFVRFSLGGVRDEAEIRGHRRTYIGALPGKIIQMLKKAESENPVLLLDEIDKMNADFRGDPASALLEVLDPEQNKSFNDHYMEVDVDLSRVLFVTTANTTDGIPWALQDRMEIIRLPGYTRLEKMKIARHFLIPRLLKEHGLDRERFDLTPEGLEFVIDSYTREAGVRNLHREIASLCRKVARKLGESESVKKITLTPETVRALLGPVHYKDAEVELLPEIGTVTGLAWTEVGGEILSVEATTMPGKGVLQLTGKLGDVMQESAKAAFSYIRANAERLGIAPDFYEKKDIHVHLPEGAIPKDGPSAGVALVTALVSVLSGVPVRRDIAMTGEITLRGKVLKIGGLKEKVIAAHRAKMVKVLIPADNLDDLEEVSALVRKQVEFIPVHDVNEVLQLALVRKEDLQQPVVAKPENEKPPKKATRKPVKRTVRKIRPSVHLK
ncbi:TPA: endopeptidase La [Candidatus Sumerlaeota bacterium]|nr:endopeptidase La [Candidatus Sumerlaeota bacterium]